MFQVQPQWAWLTYHGSICQSSRLVVVCILLGRGIHLFVLCAQLKTVLKAKCALEPKHICTDWTDNLMEVICIYMNAVTVGKWGIECNMYPHFLPNQKGLPRNVKIKNAAAIYVPPSSCLPLLNIPCGQRHVHIKMAFSHLAMPVNSNATRM